MKWIIIFLVGMTILLLSPILSLGITISQNTTFKPSLGITFRSNTNFYGITEIRVNETCLIINSTQYCDIIDIPLGENKTISVDKGGGSMPITEEPKIIIKEIIKIKYFPIPLVLVSSLIIFGVALEKRKDMKETERIIEEAGVQIEK